MKNLKFDVKEDPATGNKALNIKQSPEIGHIVLFREKRPVVRFEQAQEEPNDKMFDRLGEIAYKLRLKIAEEGD